MRESAALRLAKNTGILTSQVTDEQFEEVNKYFNDEEIMEINSIISLLGF